MHRERTSESRPVLLGVVLGVVAAVVSLGRLWVANHEALTQVLWAEDGLFPLCVRKAGFLSCVADPFAGYLLFLPRLVAGVVAQLPVASWALAMNLAAAFMAGTLCGMTAWWVRRAGFGPVAAMVIGALPVLAPLVGLEAINAVGSLYMPLLYLCTVMICVPSPLHRSTTVIVAVTLLISALTIPLTAILLLPLAVQALRRRVRMRAALWWVAAILIGTAAQIVTALTAERPRAINVGLSSLQSYLDTLPKSLFSYWPGLIVTTFDYDVNYRIEPIAFTGAVLALGLLAAGIALAASRRDVASGAGLMVLLSLAFGLVPSLIGWANNRYFVVPVLLCGAAIVLLLDRPLRTWATTWPRRLTLIVTALALLIIWSPMLPASAWRTTPAPAWRDEVARVVAHCKTDPALTERPIFTPFWPPNWGDGLAEPSHPNVPCVVVWRWS